MIGSLILTILYSLWWDDSYSLYCMCTVHGGMIDIHCTAYGGMLDIHCTAYGGMIAIHCTVCVLFMVG